MEQLVERSISLFIISGDLLILINDMEEEKLSDECNLEDSTIFQTSVECSSVKSLISHPGKKSLSRCLSTYYYVFSHLYVHSDSVRSLDGSLSNLDSVFYEECSKVSHPGKISFSTLFSHLYMHSDSVRSLDGSLSNLDSVVSDECSKLSHPGKISFSTLFLHLYMHSDSVLSLDGSLSSLDNVNCLDRSATSEPGKFVK